MRSLQSPTLQPQTPLQLPPVRPPHRSPPHSSKAAVPVPTQTEAKPEGKDSRGGESESKPAETGSKTGEVKSVDEGGIKPAEKERGKKEGSPAIVQSDPATKDQPEVDTAPVAKPLSDPAAANQAGSNQATTPHQEEGPSPINPPVTDEPEKGPAVTEPPKEEVKPAVAELQATEVDLSDLGAEDCPLLTTETDQQTRHTSSPPPLAPQLSSGDGEEAIEESFPPEMPAEEKLGGGGGGGGEEEGELMGASEGRVSVCA